MKPERRRDLRGGFHPRFPDSREIRQRFLIVCEGEKTEPLYFEAFKVPKDVRTIKIVGTGRNTITLVSEAIKLKVQGEYDQVWCVFDVEDYSAQSINSARDLARRNGISVAISNQKFELWYLLHYNFEHTPMDRQQYDQKLSDLLGFQYGKNICIYQLLIDRQQLALSRARQLLDQYNLYDPAHNNPSTSVHLLVEELNRFTPEARAQQRKPHD